MAGNINIAARKWFDDRPDIVAPWPASLVELDLKFWADEKACEGRKRPSIRQLSSVWGWSRGRVERTLRAWDTCGTPPGQREPLAGQNQDSRSANNADNEDDLGHNGPEAGQDGPSVGQRGTAPSVTRARTSPSPSPSPSPEHTERAERAARVQAAYNAYRQSWASPPSGLFRSLVPTKHPRRPANTDGHAMWDLTESDAVTTKAVVVLEWLAKSRHDRAENYRENGRRLLTVKRKLDELHEIAVDHPVGSEAPRRTSRSAMTPMERLAERAAKELANQET